MARGSLLSSQFVIRGFVQGVGCTPTGGKHDATEPCFPARLCVNPSEQKLLYN